MKSLNDLEPGTMVIIKKIEGGSEIKKNLEELGVIEGVELTVLSTGPVHVHSGAISLALADGEVVISRGWADKINIKREDKLLPLLQLEKGEKGIVKSIKGGKDFEGFVSDLGIKPGEEIAFLRHLPDVALVLKIGDKEIKMGEGQASKVFVEHEGKSIQINYLKPDEKSKIVKVAGGASLVEKFEQMGVGQGDEITLIGREEKPPSSKKGSYVLAKIGEELITIGHGLAEKVLVE
jgi:Fe2+ transport system protein FeoA